MAVKNASSKEKTLKNMIKLMPSDSYSLDRVAEYCIYPVDGDTSIVINGYFLDDYRHYFDNRTVEVDVPKKYYYQPAAFAEMYYGTPDLDFLVLYFAKMTSLFEFNRPTIKILPTTEILELTKLFSKISDDVRESYESPTEYIKQDI